MLTDLKKGIWAIVICLNPFGDHIVILAGLHKKKEKISVYLIMLSYFSGVTYIKFSKTSEAATAMEEMNGRCIGGHPRPLKVLIAHRYIVGNCRENS